MNEQKITAGAFIYHNKKVLIIKRAPTETFAPNHWELPGGHVEFGETIEEGVLREAVEEIGFSIDVKNTIHSFTYVIDTTMRHYVEVVNFCTPKSDAPEVKLNPEEHSSYKWINSEQELEGLDMFFEEKNAVIAGFKYITQQG